MYIILNNLYYTIVLKQLYCFNLRPFHAGHYKNCNAHDMCTNAAFFTIKITSIL